MSLIRTDNKHYQDIANAIRGKNGLTDKYKPEQMAAAIAAITAGAELPAKTIEFATATTIPSSESNSITFNVLGEPKAFTVSLRKTTAFASPNKVAAIAYTGSAIHGTIFTSSNYTTATDFTHNFANGVLTITSTNEVFVSGAEYILNYWYGDGEIEESNQTVATSNSLITTLSVTGLSEQPEFFIIQLNANVASSTQYHRVGYVIYDGTNIYGLEFFNKQVIYSNTAWSFTYSNGTLTLRSSSASVGGYWYYNSSYRFITIKKAESEENGGNGGNGSGGGANIGTTQATPASGGTSVSFDVEGEPLWFTMYTTQVGLEEYTYARCLSVTYDGETTKGLAFYLSSTAYVTCSDAYDWTYANGQLTVTSNSTDNTNTTGGYMNSHAPYQLVYGY